ncbi:MAG: hypothetical protein CFE24_00210 [Flavobacterium sp. BFFFF2]|nr:MAG: hypothetical protein CFE24_00210 [Flavobacterium sp. BFFFF2]
MAWSLFKSADEPANNIASFWIPLTASVQLNELLSASKEGFVLVFKHSTRCGISKNALKYFEKELDEVAQNNCYYLDLLNYRPVSNDIAQQWEVEHQSPQLIVLKDGKVLFSASHEQIDAKVVNRLYQI